MTAPSSAWRVTPQANIVLPGLYAWVATVLFPAFSPESPRVARLASVLALAALVAGPFLATKRPRLGRGVGVVGFAVLALATWAFCPAALSIDRIDPVQACLGAVGWTFFAFGWGAVRDVGLVPEDDPRALGGAPLRARGALPVGAVLVFVVAVLAAVAPLVAAWRVVRPPHAILGHAVATLCAIATITVGVEVAVARTEKRAERSPGQRMRSAARPLAALFVVLAAGVIWSLLQ